jgi:hypothetical protein
MKLTVKELDWLIGEAQFVVECNKKMKEAALAGVSTDVFDGDVKAKARYVAGLDGLPAAAGALAEAVKQMTGEEGLTIGPKEESEKPEQTPLCVNASTTKH